ncbi:MCE family protein [Mycolicibacterium pyrenivorans]|uniref:MCE family protein n=1 Tax=Mycolicibacterium pyrenivorans TaxID=187102 RepID=UPI0021F35BA7|nr:MlaD family protein [Mycolicibacterium pyrenivorans]MCV7152891.1 MCE family protein [Mycolicibacterium pyrenivorans]
MLTRFIRVQLIVFAMASVIGMTAMAVVYLQVPALLGFGHITVTMELPASGGLYRFSNVTYRGVQVGKVMDITLTPTGAQAELSLDSKPRIPSDLVAEVRSLSAVGEQYVELKPRHDESPYLADGSVIVASDVSIPQPVGPMLDRVSALLGSIPKDKLSTLVDESFQGLNGAGYDLGSLLESGATLSADLKSVADQTRTLIDDSGPLLDGQVESADNTRLWARSLAGVTDQLVANDPQIRGLLQAGPGALGEASQLLDQIKPTLPILLANLSSLGQVAVTYRPSLEQLLVLLPPYLSYLQSSGPENNSTGIALADFRAQMGDTPPCTVGFLPPSQWRSPADTTTIDTPDGLYCKLPQDSPIAVRGARNLPCMGHPGKRAPTVEICNSDKPYKPAAMRQHTLGPDPFDPNLVAQGVPIDQRVLGEREPHIYGPIEGTPMPGGDPLPPTVPPVPNPPDPSIGTPPPPGGPLAVIAPSSYDTGAAAGPRVTAVEYDPRTGRYLTPDGTVQTQTNLAGNPARTWQGLVLPENGS